MNHVGGFKQVMQWRFYRGASRWWAVLCSLLDNLICPGFTLINIQRGSGSIEVSKRFAIDRNESGLISLGEVRARRLDPQGMLVFPRDVAAAAVNKSRRAIPMAKRDQHAYLLFHTPLVAIIHTIPEPPAPVEGLTLATCCR